MLTVAELVGAFELSFAAGERAADAPIRWVHVSEQEDPTPWLSGGEVLLSTGIALTRPERQRAYIRRLAEHHLAGLGLGTGFAHATLPEALVEEARALEFPLFEVPYEMPFIAITEQAFAQLVNEQFGVLQRAVAIQRRMERLVLEERGLEEIVRGLANAMAATVVVLDLGGRVLASHPFRRSLSPELLATLAADVARRARVHATGGGESGRGSAGAGQPSFHVDLPELAAGGLAVSVPAGARHSAPCLLLAVPENESVADFERFLAHHAVMVVALALLRERVVDSTERRLGGSLLGAGLAGRIEGEELLVRLAPFGLGETVAVLLLAVEDPDRLEPRLDAILDQLGARALITTVATSRRRLLCAVLAADSRDAAALLELAARARDELARDGGEVRAAISGGAPIVALRRSFHEARCALEIGGLGSGAGVEGAPAVASTEDLGAYRLLLALQEDDGLRQYCTDVLGPIEHARGGNGEELLRSLEAFLEHNGSWESAARALFCHRHTLRYRMNRVEQLTGRHLDRIDDRIELWLALRGRELVAEALR
jgi:purine catabolism regulator